MGHQLQPALGVCLWCQPEVIRFIRPNTCLHGRETDWKWDCVVADVLGEPIVYGLYIHIHIHIHIQSYTYTCVRARLYIQIDDDKYIYIYIYLCIFGSNRAASSHWIQAEVAGRATATTATTPMAMTAMLRALGRRWSPEKFLMIGYYVVTLVLLLYVYHWYCWILRLCVFTILLAIMTIAIYGSWLTPLV